MVADKKSSKAVKNSSINSKGSSTHEEKKTSNKGICKRRKSKSKKSIFLPSEVCFADLNGVHLSSLHTPRQFELNQQDLLKYSTNPKPLSITILEKQDFRCSEEKNEKVTKIDTKYNPLFHKTQAQIKSIKKVTPSHSKTREMKVGSQYRFYTS